ncbi:B12-binding domain-containing radical SAM protein [Candidatus Woesearchaeota archaeon]|nr:B12-binding domain-containing radical SAM protein [Candidatus Woesearchaeota archaeon]
MKVSLINPPFNIFKEGYGSKVSINKGNLPPLGLTYIAAYLEKAGIEVQIIDASALNYTFQQIESKINEFSTDVIGLTSLTATADVCFKLSEFLKTRFNLPIVLGGAHATCFPKEVLDSVKEINVVTVGESELIVVELFNKLYKNEDLSQVKGIYYRDDSGNIINTGPAPTLKNLDDLPMPARHLLDNSIYCPLPNQYKKTPVTTIVTSRGCPYGKCAFCYQAGIKAQTYRRHSPERIIKEIKLLVEDYGIKEIAFWDDNFLINELWISKFCRLLKDSNLNIVWSCIARVDTTTRKMLEEISKAGCWSIFYGLESGNQELLDNIQKGITLQQIRETIKATHEFGIETRCSFMLALPGETPEKAMNTINFAIELDCTYAQFMPTHPEFGTRLYELALKTGQINQYKGRTTATFVPKGYKDSKEVEDIVKRAHRKFYFRPKYVLKHLMKIKGIDDIRRIYEGVKFISGIGF